MKKKNNKKLARNTIRARRAIKKREDEQKKTKQAKRLSIRIASVIGCLLLVSALVLPCFADTDFSGVSVVSVAPEKAYTDFRSTLNTSDGDTHALGYLMEWYRSNNTTENLDIGVFRANTLVSGEVTTDTSVLYVPPNEIRLDDGASYVIDSRIDYAVLYFSPDGSYNLEENYRLNNCYYEVSFYSSNSTLTVTFNFYNDEYDLYLYYDALWDDEYLLRPSEFAVYNANGDLESTYRFTPSSYLEIAYTPSDGYANSIYNEYLAHMLGMNIISPYTYWIGWSKATNYLAGSNSYQKGYDTGYDQGYDIGYQDGYDDGVQYMDVDAYQVGYDAAVRDISSGDFGKNLLGASFSAPFEAVTGITLLDWTNSEGDVVRLTVGTLITAVLGVSLFIWFLKIFAGG